MIGGSPQAASHLDTLLTEGRSRRSVLLKFKDGGSETTELEVEPYNMRSSSEGYRLFFYAIAEDKAMAVHIDCILEVKPTGRSFVPRFRIEL